MKCLICKNGDTQPGFARVTVHRGSSTVIIKQVPADICDNCGEYYLDQETTRAVMAEAEAALLSGEEVRVLVHEQV